MPPFMPRRLVRLRTEGLSTALPVVSMLSLLHAVRRSSLWSRSCCSCCRTRVSRDTSAPLVSWPPVGCLVLIMTGGAVLYMGETDLRRIAREVEAFMALASGQRTTSALGRPGRPSLCPSPSRLFLSQIAIAKKLPSTFSSAFTVHATPSPARLPVPGWLFYC